MAYEELPSDIARFIRAHIDSVGQLEILLLLHASEGKDLTVRQINERLRSNPSSVQSRLDTLESHGLVASRSAEERLYRFEPKAQENARTVEHLARYYSDFRVRVIDWIFAPRDQIKNFSDAFRLKEDERDNG